MATIVLRLPLPDERIYRTNGTLVFVKTPILYAPAGTKDGDCYLVATDQGTEMWVERSGRDGQWGQVADAPPAPLTHPDGRRL